MIGPAGQRAQLTVFPAGRGEGMTHPGDSLLVMHIIFIFGHRSLGWKERLTGFVMVSCVIQFSFSGGFLFPDGNRDGVLGVKSRHIKNLSELADNN
jgi:hypothetical protein